MNKNKNEFTYDYPPYADPILKIQGVYFFEWFLIVAILVLPALALGWKAFIFGAMGAILIFSLCVRSEERRLNLWNQLISFSPLQ